ncbi:MAG: hypothetical protein Q9216_002866 [Gyalolechia sp. 2 TL-2023]
MYLQANPRRRKAEEEKEELKRKYKPGEQVLPRVEAQERDIEDERMLAEVREMSLREVGARAPGSYERGMRHRTAERPRDPNENNRQRRGHQHAESSLQASPGGGAHRSIGHQSSLRSLMSNSEIDSSEMEEEILRLVDEGWLDGIDLDSLDTSQVDELSERIADAYRRRHGDRSTAGAVGAGQPRRPQDRSRRTSRDRSSNRSNRSSGPTEQSRRSSRPPVARPRLLEAYPTGHSQQRRASSEQRRQTSPSARSSARRAPSANHHAARSATDLTAVQQSSSSRFQPAELSHRNRRTTDSDQHHRDRSGGEAQPEAGIHRNAAASEDTSARPEANQSQPRPSLPFRASDPGNSNAENHPRRSSPTTRGPLDSSSTDALMAGTTFVFNATEQGEDVFIGMALDTQRYKGTSKVPKTQPSEKILHLTVSLDGSTNGLSQKRFNRRVLKQGHCWSPRIPWYAYDLALSVLFASTFPTAVSGNAVAATKASGDSCNDGDFNICTGSYLKLVSDGRISADNGDKGWRKCPSGHRMIVVGFEDSPAGQRRVIVRDLVGGHGLKHDGSSAEESMKQEWSWQDGQQRQVRTLSKPVSSSLNESRDAGTTAGPLLRRYPPSGGTGMRVLALWTYLPRDEAQDELSFPKGAEIQEVENINGDWFVGCYAGRSGLFPGNYVRVLDIVRA